MAQAKAELHTLSNANGSATYTSPKSTLTIIAGVNYPVEVPYRSDEIPESTHIEVNVRPNNGVDMVKERHIESLVTKTLRAVVLGEETPRTMLQVTLQVASIESDESLPGGVKGGGQGETYLDLLVGAVNAAVLGCLDAGVQMRSLVGAALIGFNEKGDVVVSPRVQERKRCRSLHVFAYTAKGQCVLMESEGRFQVNEWEAAERTARQIVVDGMDSKNEDVDMTGGASAPSVIEMMRKSVEARVAKDKRWREN